ncbi:right-handed parallel beta-helix repeat-containing protein [Microbacterium sp. 3J1]|uniref:right-handed parallel beta-helix repeat-containing protein n=1 Tax=Microbacterium sp. 3J1 TaxID=861269 RepID=UPI000AAEF7C1|nr:right-handed parallel beta-helix repeat-containing protein [Microbacterium sp. 3J1]
MTHRLVAVDDSDYRLPDPVMQALELDFAREATIDANRHGVKADGITDDSPAWQAIVNTALTGSVITWTGRSMLRTPIIWKTGISLIGEGWGRSVLATVDNGIPTWHAAIRWVEGDGASITNTLEDCVWANFEVDGSQLSTGGQYKISAKGLFTLYHRNCQWRNLYIHDTQATGLGCDFMPGSLITGCLVTDCGYMNPGNAGGGAGIGIGTGAWEVEDVIITGNTTRNNGNWGIFVEVQEYTDAYINQGIRGTGARIIGNTSYHDRVGFGDRGTVGTLIQGNVAHSPTVSGVSVSFGSREGAVLDNHVYKSGAVGIFVQTNVTDEVVAGNHVYDSGTHGIHIQAMAAANKAISIRDNVVSRSNNCGILVDCTSGSTDGLMIRGNRVWNNGKAGGVYTQGIRMEANASAASISGNRVFDDQATKTQGAGLQLSASNTRTLSDASIDNNNFTGSTVAVSLSSHTRTNVTIGDNVGYLTANQGTATIADGASTVTVPHGLGGVPSQVQLTPNGSAQVWINAKGVSNIIIQRLGTSGPLTVDWTATYRP